MDFRLSAEQEELRQAARHFARAELPRVAEECEQDNVPEDVSACVRERRLRDSWGWGIAGALLGRRFDRRR